MTEFGHANNPDSQTFAESMFEPPQNRSTLECDAINICQPCGITCEDGICSTSQCSIACLDQDYSDRRGKVPF